LLFYNRYLIKKQILILIINRILELKNYDWN